MALEGLRTALSTVVRGQDEAVDRLLVALLSEGHVLLEDVPGVGKTTLARALAKALGMQTVAEGVEAMDELALVKERGADLVQGYIFSKPLAQDEVLEQLSGSVPLFIPDGPPRHRADRMTMLRKSGLSHEDL